MVWVVLLTLGVAVLTTTLAALFVAPHLLKPV